MDPLDVQSVRGAGSAEADLDIEIDKSISMPAPPRVEEDAMPRIVYITRAVLNQYGITDGCVGCGNTTMGDKMIANRGLLFRPITGTLQKTPNSGNKSVMISRSEMFLAFLFVARTVTSTYDG